MRSPSIALALMLAGFAAATAGALAFGRLLNTPTAAAWLYLPLALVVALRWGRVAGIAVSIASDVLVLTFLIPPVGLPLANDPRAYFHLAVASIGTVVAVLTVAEINRRRLAAERQGRAEAESLAEIGRHISASLDLDEVLQTATESVQRLVRADVVSIALTSAPHAMPAVALVGNRTAELQLLAAPANTGITRRALESRGPTHVLWDDSDASAAAYPAARRAMEAEGIRSTLAMPIYRGDEAVGVLWVHARTRREFTGNEIALLDRLAGQAAVAIANAQALSEELAARAEVEALLASTATLGAQAEPEAVLRTLVDQAASLLQAERGVFAIPRQERLVVPADWVDGEWIEDEHDVRPAGILRTVWVSGRPYRTNDVTADDQVNRELVVRYHLRSQLTVPLVAPNGEHLGLISLNNSRRPEGFTPRDERLLLAICETGTAVLLRARDGAARAEAEQAATRRQQEVEALLSAADQLNGAVDPEEVLLGVVGIAADLIGVVRAGIVTNEGDHAMRRHTLTDRVWRSEETVLPFADSIGGWVIQHGRAYRTDDLSSANLTFYPASGKGTPASVLAVPIVARDGRILGALNLFDRRDGLPFSDGDQRLSEGLAHHAAVALERATLIQELRNREDYLRAQAVTDPLTGLPNRTLFLERVTVALNAAKRQTTGVAVLFLDLDGFKVVNDSLGHHVGDILLQAVGERLVEAQREGDTVARFGGDEFAILLEGLDKLESAIAVANFVIDDLNRPFTSDAYSDLVIRASIGVSFRAAEAEERSAEELIREADIALYQAKAAGKAQAVGFAPIMGRRAVERLDLQTDLERALENGEWRLLYQPIVNLGTQAIVGAEALLRWQHPRRGLLSPAEFIGLAEETGLILAVGRWVLREACRQAVIWRSGQPEGLQFGVSVNLSARQFEQPKLLEQVADALRDSGLPTAALMLEITETALIQNPESAIATLAVLKQLGVRIAIDDFGTGYSSLSYLRRLSVDVLKIDRSFLEELHRSDSTSAIVQATIAMAHALGVEVTAEGIETAEQLSILQELGCDSGQGFLLSEPISAERFAGLATHVSA